MQTGGVGGRDADGGGGVSILSANTEGGGGECRVLKLAGNTTKTIDDTSNNDNYTEGRSERERMGRRDK